MDARSECHPESGGGLAEPLKNITLLDVYCTVGEPSLFSRLVSEDHSECLVEQAVNAHLAATLLEAEAVLLKKFEMVTIAMLAGEFETSALRSKSSRAVNK